MDISFGVIHFAEPNIGYEIIRKYYQSNGLKLAGDDPETKLISNMNTKNLVVKNEGGTAIEGELNQITRMAGEGFEISVACIPYSFYEEEFPHHVEAYEKLFNKK